MQIKTKAEVGLIMLLGEMHVESETAFPDLRSSYMD